MSNELKDIPATKQDYEDLRHRIMDMERTVEFASLLHELRAHG